MDWKKAIKVLEVPLLLLVLTFHHVILEQWGWAIVLGVVSMARLWINNKIDG